MNNLIYEITKNDSLNRWFLTETKEKYYDSKPGTMEAKIDNSWLDEGFSIHTYPCRKQFREENKDKKIDLYKDEDFNDLYFPFENPKVERSGFWFLPTYLSTWAKTYVEVPETKEYSFTLRTCGGVKIWVNGESVVKFTPYTRNIEQLTQVRLPLKEGKNEIIVFFDDLAERDTLYYFQLKYLDSTGLKVMLPVQEESEKIKNIENILAKAYFSKDTFTEGPVSLYFPFSPSEELELEVNASGDFMDFIASEKKELLLTPGNKDIKLGNVTDYSMGFNYFKIAVNIKDIVIERILGVQIYQKELLVEPAASLKERKKQNLEFIAEHGELISQRALAMVAEGKELEKARTILEKELSGIEKRKDCSDFYLVPILWLWIRYRDQDVFDEDFWEYAKEVILGFRYWIDEPGNDVMWYFSENHALLFHTSELLAGQIFPEENFKNADIKGEVHKKKAEKRLEEWFERFFAEGFAEWNSTAYLPIDLIGFFAIYELAESKDLRGKAKKAIDETFRLIALNSHHGIMACSHGRTYEKELKGRYVNYTTSLCWTAWGTGFLNEATNAQTLFCLSSYEPEEKMAKYADWENDTGLIFKNTQGKAGFVDLYLYKNSDYMLTSAVEFKGGNEGYQEHVLQGTLGPEALVWVNHPGENIPVGFGRPSYWAGNGYLPRVSQYKDIAIALYDIDSDHPVDFTHAYFPVEAFDEIRNKGSWYFARKGAAYVAIYAENGLELIKEGISKNRELVSPGYKNCWLIRFGNRNQFDIFENFIDKVKGDLNVKNSQEINYKDPRYGNIKFSWKQPLSVVGKEVQIENLPPMGKVIIE